MDKTPNKDRLIKALRSSAEALRGGCRYEWIESESCNCGVLAEHLLGKKVGGIGSWGQAAMDITNAPNCFCYLTGMRISDILDTMRGFGMSNEDINNLELLRDPCVLKRVGVPLKHSYREDVILYMEAWADILEEQQQVEELGRCTETAPRVSGVRCAPLSVPEEPAIAALQPANATLV